MSQIRSLEGVDIHKLTSGQVIIDLTTAVKELVDNSIDAHSSQIDILFKNYGTDSFECSDNGDGISTGDLDTLALKHYTSKISSFEDIAAVGTLGFRGEALSSLCGISHVCVTTTVNPPKAYKVEYNESGHISGKTITSRNKGTTVQVSNLFHNLPVRQKEFIRTIKRQYQKCISLLQSYSLIQDKINFSVWNITGTGKKSLVLSTSNKKTILKNCINVFGSSAVSGVAEMSIIIELNPTHMRQQYKFDEESQTPEGINYTISVEGYISKSSFGCGRNSKDRQFLYINKRPIEYPQLLKNCNDVYRSFNNVQYPFILLNFQVDTRLIDINVTPDKRTVLLHNEQYVIDLFREHLLVYYQNQDLQLPKTVLSQGTLAQSQEIFHSFAKDEEGNSSGEDSDAHISNQRPAKRSRRDDVETGTETTFDKLIQDSPDTEAIEQESSQNLEESESELEKSIYRTLITEDTAPDTAEFEAEKIETLLEDEQKKDMMSTKESNISVDAFQKFRHGDDSGTQRGIEENTSSQPKPDTIQVNIDGEALEFQATYSQDKELVILQDEPDLESSKNESRADDAVQPYVHQELNPRVSYPISEKELNDSVTPRALGVSSREGIDEPDPFIEHLETTVSISKCDMSLTFGSDRMSKSSTTQFIKKDPEETDEYLTLTVNKQEFEKMMIVGQFNLGFIITRRVNPDGKFDLFIVDQHASDEKYNFETLQRTTKFQSQQLLVPRVIELPFIDELIVMDNINVFESNGFKLSIEEDDATGQRIKLMSFPYSKQTVFDMDDFDELLQLIKDQNGSPCSHVRCSKVRAMFAMRACRSSIMIGKPLTKTTMARVVKHLGTLDKPWNCPHGRPTMRHLLELTDWRNFNNDYKLN
ncbi:ATP-binding mismatch repair protein KNAG_0B05200 [Huiozyma naganishii CBS 8797]|uniref:DNA mismatch repair protein PMS1 n=1 Tax=Huiozyma naganishii (strain ATCC MYA-139 / BCRC 22969 / CBS 8797 / KCTC 17520 / NBRC 10181 / NCYC 3082 / Yp74L-3) TaxID=1071383 RepID=J7RVJ3_HUIN7|nr:hypothetical protein KNAG_0B05200 [Kazachstania naganishii CBS 8797]CCK68952.1 hypothetical protein KNAG_0B05200 [Kazachstania naganishii CBS 8797]